MTKVIYHIGEFAEIVGISSYTLRYYENEKLIVPHRDDNNRRFYTEDDYKWLKFLLHLKSTGMTMSEIKKYVHMRAQGDSTIEERQQLLKEVQQRALKQITEIENSLKIVNHKIDWYSGKLSQEIAEDETFETYLKNFNL